MKEIKKIGINELTHLNLELSVKNCEIKSIEFGLE